MVAPYLPTVTSDCIIDLSHWNGAVDFTAVFHAGIRAVFLKATQGAHPQGRDPLYHEHAAAAVAAHLLSAPYHFMTHEAAQPQFDELHAVVNLKPGMVVMLDWEGEHIPADLVAELGTLVEHATGRAPLIYTGRYQLQHPHAVLATWPLMLAEFGTHPVCPPGWDKWLIHQYTDKGSVAGVHGHVDRSLFAGTEADLEVWWKGAPAIVAQASAVVDSNVTDESPFEHVLTTIVDDAIAVVQSIETVI